jgi:S-DNA-T family DNA segregation ATPase FtsK/SpoIIIE
MADLATPGRFPVPPLPANLLGGTAMTEERYPEPDPEPEFDDIPDDAAEVDEDLDDDEVIEGEVVVPFPGPAAEPPKRQRAGGEHAELRDIIPAHLSTWAGIKKAVTWRYKHARHHILFHLIRLPKMLPLACVWAVVGLLRVDMSFIAWAFATEQAYLRGMAIEGDDIKAYLQVHKEGKQTRLFRVPVLIAAHVIAVIAGVVMTLKMPLLWIPAGLLALPFLASAGRPDDKPIVESAVVPTAYERLSRIGVVRALSVLSIGELNKALAKNPDTAIEFIDDIARDGPGWLARIDLPHGVTAAEVMDARENLASGLRRQIGCVWPENERKRHPGALNLWVGDEDMSQAPQPPWPLAKRGTVDMFKPVPFATDQRGRAITITLMFVSIIIGSIPRMGKTFLLRLIGLICALDIRAELHVFDWKGTGDLEPLAQVAHRYRAGDDAEDIDYAIADYRELRTEMRRRTKVIRRMARERPELCPENKITPELANMKELGLHPIVILGDECQVPFESKYAAEFEEIATDLAKRGPALGMLQALATQRPDAKSIPTGISANVVMRMCLKVMGFRENDMVLGQSAHKNGYRATMFDFEDKGIFYFGGEGSAPRISRGHEIDGPAAKLIATRARVLRENAGRITGYAAGQDQDPVDARRILDDVLTVFGDAKGLWCETIAERLAGSYAEIYADITADAVASQLRAQDVNVRGVRDTTRRGEGPRSGCYRAEVETAAGNTDV